MNARQDRAIKMLQRAVTRCGKCGLSMAGVDDALIIFETSDFVAVSNGRGPAEVINEMNYCQINGPYIDSGGT